MSPDQMMAALNALSPVGEVALHMRKPGDWYLLVKGVEIGGDGTLGLVGGNGLNPFNAIENYWNNATRNLPTSKYLVLSALQSGRRHVRWNGFMWEDLPVAK